MLVAPIGVKDQAGGPRFVVELDLHAKFERQFGYGSLRQAEGPSAKARS